MEALKDQLKDNGYDPTYYLLDDTPMTTATRPYQSKGKQKIYIITNDGKIKEITEVSSIMKALADSKTQSEPCHFIPR